MIYAILTLVAIALDFIVIFVGVGGLSEFAGAFGSVWVLLLGIIYFLIALYFVG